MQKTTYKRPQRSIEELNKICGDAFRAVKVPERWKFKEYERLPLDPGAEPEDMEIQAIAAVFVDKTTKGMDLTHYRLNFHTYSETLSITEVTFKDYGKNAYNCLISNKAAEQLNEYITNNLN